MSRRYAEGNTDTCRWNAVGHESVPSEAASVSSHVQYADAVRAARYAWRCPGPARSRRTDDEGRPAVTQVSRLIPVEIIALAYGCHPMAQRAPFRTLQVSKPMLTFANWLRSDITSTHATPMPSTAFSGVLA